MSSRHVTVIGSGAQVPARSLALWDADEPGLRAFAHGGCVTANWLAHETPLDLQPIRDADDPGEFPGGRAEGGRRLEPQPKRSAERAAAMIREAPNITAPITCAELACMARTPTSDEGAYPYGPFIGMAA